MQNLYDILGINPDSSDIVRWIENATRERRTDIDDYNNQVSSNSAIFSAPASSTDMVGTEKVGDIAADSAYFYVVVDDSGTLEWRRVAISSF